LKQYTQQNKQLKLIGWLMLISASLLSLFIFQWIKSQYREAEQRLKEDVQLIFTTIENNIQDSILNRQVAAVMGQQTHGDSSLHTLSFATKDSSLQTAPIRGKRSIHFYSNKPGAATILHQNDTAAADAIIIGPDAAPADHQVANKVLRLALQEIMNNIDVAAFKTETDTALLRKEFSTAVVQRFGDIDVRWRPANEAFSLFMYRSRDAAKEDAYLSLTGYRLYLFKDILPQAIFCLALLLLTVLAFILAYRNTRQQNLFVRQKDHFISNISHELKTPVATTKIALEALSRYDALEDPQRAQRYLKMANWEINRLETMISKIMDTTQADHGVLALDLQKVSLPELVQELTDSWQQLLIEAQVSLQLDIREQVAFVKADYTHLTGAIYNLLDNAVKYGNKRIRISIYKSDKSIYLEVADNGEGIPQAYRVKIFEKFVRIPQENIHNIKGYGLGLSYAKYIIEAHRGRLTLERETGWGAVFSICLPEYSAEDEV